jgi:ribosome recycling factor
MSTATQDSAEDRMKKAVETLETEFKSIRTGRASPNLLDRVEVEYYGTPTALKSLSNISVPDGRSLVITPYDKASLKDIEQAIHKSGLGLTPNNDGSVVRINIPVLTEDRRKELVKIVRKVGEEQKVAIRNIRRDSAEDLKKLKGEVSEDEIKRQEESLQKLTDKYIKEVDRRVGDKEKEIMDI